MDAGRRGAGLGRGPGSRTGDRRTRRSARGRRALSGSGGSRTTRARAPTTRRSDRAGRSGTAIRPPPTDARMSSGIGAPPRVTSTRNSVVSRSTSHVPDSVIDSPSKTRTLAIGTVSGGLVTGSAGVVDAVDALRERDAGLRDRAMNAGLEVELVERQLRFGFVAVHLEHGPPDELAFAEHDRLRERRPVHADAEARAHHGDRDIDRGALHVDPDGREGGRERRPGTVRGTVRRGGRPVARDVLAREHRDGCWAGRIDGAPDRDVHPGELPHGPSTRRTRRRDRKRAARRSSR